MKEWGGFRYYNKSREQINEHMEKQKIYKKFTSK